MNSLKNSWAIIKSANKAFVKYPKLAAPIFMTWAMIVPLFLYMDFVFNPEDNSVALFGVGVYIVILSILITMSCSILLELIEQLESGQEINLTKAFKDSWLANFVKILPISLTYAFIWFVITVINALIKPKKEHSKNKDFSARNAAHSLAGTNSPFSLSSLLSDMLLKAIRMLVYLILPAICWEGKGPWQATKRGWGIFSKHKGEFMSGFFMSELAALVVFLPAGLAISFLDNMDNEVADIIWYIIIVYTGIAWSYCMYLEQMFSAELFLWYKKWEKINEESCSEVPLKDVEKPSLLDDVYELTTEA